MNTTYLIDALIFPGEYVAEFVGLSPGTPDFLAASVIVNLALYFFIIRSIIVFIARFLGIYHPGQYRYFPRMPWRIFYKIYLEIKRWYERVFLMGRHSTGGFAGLLEVFTLLYKPGQVLFGRAAGLGVGLLQPVGGEISRHLFCYAMTGGGKTTMLITVLSTWNNSAFVIDPKSQITNALYAYDWRKWVVLDPYGISNTVSASFNAIDCIREAMARDGDQMAVLWATRVAQALIVTPTGSRTPYFTDTARGFLVGVILFVLDTHTEEDFNLPYIRFLIVNGIRVFNEETGEEETKGKEAQDLLLRSMANNMAFEGAIAGAAAAMSNASGEAGGNVRSTLLEQTKWLDIPNVRNVLCSTTMPLSELKTRDDVVFSLTAPVLSIREELAPLCRLLTNMTAYTFESVKEKKGQCLTIIDELPSQGYNETLEVMLAVARSYGQTVLGISQNIELMKKAYPNSWSTFSGEADAVFWMATNHNDTAMHLTQTLGQKTHVDRDPYTGQKSYREVTVMDADQVKRFLAPGSDNLIVTRAGMRALRLKNEPYFKALPVWKYAADPAHKEAFLRRFMRGFFGVPNEIVVHSTAQNTQIDTTSIQMQEPVETEQEPEIASDNVIPFPDSARSGDKK